MQGFAAALMLMALAAGVGAAPAPAALPRDSVYALDVPLRDQAGRPLVLADKRGRAQLAVMFYTGCTVICPTIIDTVLDLDRQLAPAERERLGVLMITLDPQHDSPAALQSTASKRQLDLSRWALLQPRPADVRTIAGVLGVRFRRLANGEVNHTGVLVLLDAQGRIVARSSKTSGKVEPAFAAQVHTLLGAP